MDEAIAHIDLARTDRRAGRIEPGDLAHIPESYEQDYHAMVLSLRDYMRKTGFKKVLLGLSGGIDWAIVATIRRRCAGARECALRDAAVGIHLAIVAG